LCTAWHGFCSASCRKRHSTQGTSDALLSTRGQVAMSIFSRLSDIINSNISSLLDKAEKPEKMIRMVIQDMEETLVEVRSGTAKVIAEKKTLERRAQQLHRQADSWQEKAELAMSRDREDLAKAALVEKSAVTNTIAALESELQKLDETLEKLS